jgi:glycosyltransferase involved in cell wall biosynthesis
MISAKVGKAFIDLRTVSHQKLADFMTSEYQLPGEKPQVIYIGTNFQRLEGTPSNCTDLLHQKCQVGSDQPIVLFVGRFAAQKRPEVFVKSVARMFKINPSCQAHFAMVGDGPLLDKVAKLVEHHQLRDRIHLLGAYPNAIEFLADAAILMMPSDYEGLALVSYEAMGLGIPQIFADVGGQGELITPETGILITNGDDEEDRYARACLDLLNDRGRRIRMGAAAKERVQRYFSASEAVGQYAKIFQRFSAIGRLHAEKAKFLEPPLIDPFELMPN